MPVVTGVSFEAGSKLRYFEAGKMSLSVGDMVIAQTERGLEMGRVVDPPKEVAAAVAPAGLKPLMRKATQDDLRRAREGRQKDGDAFLRAVEKIEEHGLDMKLLAVRSTFDRKRMTFFFCAEGRVDFRGLLRDLSSHFKARIDLRQLGPRDVARVVGAYGRCGLGLCCATWMTSFQPVTMKMAKEQGLALIPEKLAGACGRLRCCIRYEHDWYKDVKPMLPKIGSQVETEQGAGKVVEHRVPEGTFVVALEGGGQVEVSSPELCCWLAGEQGPPCQRSRDHSEEAKQD